MKFGIGISLAKFRKRGSSSVVSAPTVSGPLSNQSLQTGSGVVTYSTSGSFIGSSLTYSLTGGGAGITIAPSTGVISVDRAVVAASVFNLTVRATNISGFAETGFTLTVTAFALSTIGFRASLDSGTTGDIYVAKTGNDTTGTGTLGNPFLTIGRAITAATTGQEIKVRAGTYYESFNITSKQLKISRYGTERVIISGGAPLTGGVACTVADLPDVGANWANIYKFTVTTASIASGDGRAALVTEGETALPYVMAWSVDPRFPNFTSATDQWFIADEVISQVNPTPGPGEGLHITGYKLPAVTDLYTQTQIQRGFVHWHGYPNINDQSAVMSYNTTTKVVSFDGVTDGAYLEDAGDQYQKAFAIGNLLPAMKRGSWGFITSGATTTIYVWPLSTGSIASGMQYSTRGSGVTLGTNNEIRGLEFTMQSSAGTITDGMYAITSGGVTKKTNTRIINCRVFNTWRSAYNSYGGIWIGNTDDFVMEDVTIDNAYGSFGMFISGTTSSLAQRMRVRRVRVNGAEKSAARFFSQTNAFVSNLFVVEPSGLAAHANKTNIYEQGDKFVYHNCFFGGASGYMSWIETSRIAVVGSYVPTTYVGGDSRAIRDQNGTVDTPAATLGQSGASYILRNTVVPYWSLPNGSNSLDVGNSNNMEVTYTVAANSLNGAITSGPPLDRASGNYFTSGSILDASDTLSTNSATYTDHLVGDMSYKAGAPIRSSGTTNISAEIAVIKSWLPDIADAEFDKDIYGNTVNWAAVKPGVSNDYDANFGLPPILIDKPKVTGAPVLGGTMGTTPYFIVANPFPTITAKWQNSTDGITWTDISGATGATYVPVAGDLGKFVARLFTGSGISFRSQSNAPVSSSYALGDPTIMATKSFTNFSAVTHLDETGTYVSTGNPLMVVVSTRAGSSAPSTVTCTVGTPGRSYGTGTSLTQTGNIRRTQNQTHTFWLAAPSAGSVSVQVQGSLTANSWLIQVYEVAGLTSIGTPTTIGLNNAGSLTSTVTTTAPNGGVFYILNRFDGDLATNPVSVTGSDPANTVTTGGTSATLDLAISTVYARAPTSGPLAKTYSWPVVRTAGILAMELKS